MRWAWAWASAVALGVFVGACGTAQSSTGHPPRASSGGPAPRVAARTVTTTALPATTDGKTYRFARAPVVIYIPFYRNYDVFVRLNTTVDKRPSGDPDGSLKVDALYTDGLLERFSRVQTCYHVSVALGTKKPHEEPTPGLRQPVVVSLRLHNASKQILSAKVRVRRVSQHSQEARDALARAVLGCR